MDYCRGCGTKIPDGAKFCFNCMDETQKEKESLRLWKNLSVRKKFCLFFGLSSEYVR